MIETSRVAYNMVGHPGQRLIGGTFPGQPVSMTSYPHAALTAALQTPANQHILAQAGLTCYDVFNMSHGGYDLLQKQQHSPPEQQLSNASAQGSQDHPIGYGAFGVVWSVVDPRDGTRKALKKMPNVFQNTISCRRVYRELKMLTALRHDNILSALEILQPIQYLDNMQELHVLTELFQSDLHKIIVSPQPLSADHVKLFLYQLLRGLKYLHSARIIHRDIKPGNLLVNSDCQLKICDFGLARVEEPEEHLHMTQEVVTQYYRSPELLMGANHYSFEIDIWSVGCIFAELLSRRILFQANSPLKQLDMITNLLGTPSPSEMKSCAPGAVRYVESQRKQSALSSLYSLSQDATPEAVHLICQMLMFDPSKRITASAALAHPYLEEGRMRYHSCMCNCCQTTPARGGHQVLHRTDVALEPTCVEPFSYDFEYEITSLSKAKDKLQKLVSQNINKKMPLTINPHSLTYKRFATSTVAQPSELPPSPHVWE